MNILITGSRGYIGSRLRELIPYSYEECDLKLGTDYRTFPLTHYDAVIHLAGIVGDEACNSDPTNAMDINCRSLLKFIESCEEIGVKHFILISTCSIYTASPTIYSISKELAEVIVRQSLMDISILRLGTVYGNSPAMRYNLVVNRFKRDAFSEHSIKVFGGDQMRPFVHIDDVCNTIIRLLPYPTNTIQHVVGENISIRDLASLVSSVSGCKVIYDTFTNDARSYNIPSDVITTKTIEEYINE